MRDALATLASAFLADAALPLLLWTALALLLDAALRLGRAHAALSLPVRTALLAALPAVLVAGPVARWATPAAVVVSEPLVRVRSLVLPEVVVGGAAGLAPAGPPAPLVWLGAALVLAALIGVVMLVRLAVAHVRLSRLAIPEAPADVQDAALAALDAAGVRRTVRVVSGGAVPFTFGAWRPVVAVPPAMSGEALRLALAHEAAHIRAGDYGWQTAARAVAAVFAAHPLVHVLARGLSLDRERLADAAVLAAYPQVRRAYVELLVSLSALPAPRLALGAARPPLLHRITAMTTTTAPARVRAARHVGHLFGLLVIAAVCLSGWVQSTPQPEVAIRLIDARVLVDGVVLIDGNESVESTPFRVLHVDVKDFGRFIVSDRPFDGAEREGTIADRRLVTAARGHRLTINTSAPLLSGGAHSVPIYVRFDAVEGAAPLVPGDARLRHRMLGLSTDLGTLGPIGELPAPLMALSRMTDRLNTATALLDALGTAGPSRTASADTVLDMAETMPELVGGLGALQARLVYPAAARASGAEGTIILRFVVTPDGRTEQIRVLRGVDPRLDTAAVQAVRAQPFRPGRQGGEAVAVRMTLPVSFRLSGSDQGAAPARGVVRYAGVDLSRLENGPQIQAMIDALPARLDAEGVSYGDVRVEYLIDPDGTTRRFRVTSGPRDLHDAAVSVARALRTAEDARPGASTEGFFRLWYTAG